MSKSLEQRLPDRTGILIAPFCFGLPAVAFGLALVWKALSSRSVNDDTYESAGTQIAFGVIGALADALGVVGSIAVAAVICAAVGVWMARVVMRYRRMVAADRIEFGVR